MLNPLLRAKHAETTGLAERGEYQPPLGSEQLAWIEQSRDFEARDITLVALNKLYENPDLEVRCCSSIVNWTLCPSIRALRG